MDDQQPQPQTPLQEKRKIKKQKTNKIDLSIPLKETPSEEERLKQQEKSGCQYWIVNRRKHQAFFCRTQRSNDTSSIYCKLHQQELLQQQQQQQSNTSSHSVKKEEKEEESPDLLSSDAYYYKENINGETPIFSSIPLSHIPTKELQDISIKLDHIFNQLFPVNIDHYDHQHSSFERVSKVESSEKLKHIKQESSIISIMDREGLLDGESIYLEFGAGSGKLGYHVFNVLHKQSGHIMIDRMKFKSLRSKDLPIKNEPTCKYFQRCLIDIRHLDLSSIPILLNSNYTVISKHLCGCATDFTLKCLYNTISSNPILKDRFKGISIATCCHHLCTFNSYINPTFITNTLGLSQREFQTISAITSWATFDITKLKKKKEEDGESDRENVIDDPTQDNKMANTKNIEGVNYDTVFSIDRKEELGYKAKRILDYGRLLFIRDSLGLDCKMQTYTQLSKENLVISGHIPITTTTTTTTTTTSTPQ